jgi:hypothetical protein
MMTRSDHSDRAVAERIERLRVRLSELKLHGPDMQLANVIKGILDLLADEL